MHTSAVKTLAVTREHYLVAFWPASGSSEASKRRNVFCTEEVFPARTCSPFQNAHFSWKYIDSTLASYQASILQWPHRANSKGNRWDWDTRKTSCDGRVRTRCSGDSASSSCIILSEPGQYFLFCSLTIFRSLVAHHSIPAAWNLYHLEESPCLESCHTLTAETTRLVSIPMTTSSCGGKQLLQRTHSLSSPDLFSVFKDTPRISGFLRLIWEPNDQSDGWWRKCSRTASHAAQEPNPLHSQVRTKHRQPGKPVCPVILSTATKLPCLHSVRQHLWAALGNHPPTLRARCQKPWGLPGTSSAQRFGHVGLQFAHGHPDLSPIRPHDSESGRDRAIDEGKEPAGWNLIRIRLRWNWQISKTDDSNILLCLCSRSLALSISKQIFMICIVNEWLLLLHRDTHASLFLSPLLLGYNNSFFLVIPSYSN